jgi:hypothetical protein
LTTEPQHPDDEGSLIRATTSVPIDLSAYVLPSEPVSDGLAVGRGSESSAPEGELRPTAAGTPYYSDYSDVTGFYTGITKPANKAAAARPRPRPASTLPVLQPTNALAIVALVMSLVGVSLLAIVFGHVALSQIARTGERGRGMAMAALLISYLLLVVTVIILVVSAATAAHLQL